MPCTPVPEETWAAGPALPRPLAVPWRQLPGPIVGPGESDRRIEDSCRSLEWWWWWRCASGMWTIGAAETRFSPAHSRGLVMLSVCGGVCMGRATLANRPKRDGLIGVVPSAPVPEDTWASGPALPRPLAVPCLPRPSRPHGWASGVCGEE